MRRKQQAEALEQLLGAYALLGVSPGTPFEEVKAIYRLKARELHTDRGGDKRAFQELVQAFKRVEKTVDAPKPNVVTLSRGRLFQHTLAPRTPGFVIGTTDPVDGRNTMVCVRKVVREEKGLTCEGMDDNTYCVPYAEEVLPQGRALCLEGRGEPGRQGGESGDLYLWFP